MLPTDKKTGNLVKLDDDNDDDGGQGFTLLPLTSATVSVFFLFLDWEKLPLISGKVLEINVRLRQGNKHQSRRQ